MRGVANVLGDGKKNHMGMTPGRHSRNRPTTMGFTAKGCFWYRLLCRRGGVRNWGRLHGAFYFGV